MPGWLYWLPLQLARTVASKKLPKPKSGVYGQAFDAKNAVAASTLAGLDQEKAVTVTGKITDVCKAEGCWLNLDQGDGKTIRVDALGHKYTVPKDCEGKTATVNGIAKVEVTSVEELKHFATDEGKTQAEIDAITEPEKKTSGY